MPWRTSVWSPRAPSASAKASSKIDLPAPVSPVSTASPPAKSMSSRSIRTISRMDSRDSIKGGLVDSPSSKTRKAGTSPALARASTVWVSPDASAGDGLLEVGEGLADPGALVLGRLAAATLHQRIGALIPDAVGEVVTEHGGRGLRFDGDAERHIGLGQALQRFFDLARGLVFGDDDFEAVDGAGVVPALEIITADLHFLAGELVARHFELFLGLGGVLAGGKFPDHLIERRKRLFGARLVAGDVGDLVVIGHRNQILRVGGILAAGVQRDVTLGRRHGLVIVAA